MSRKIELVEGLSKPPKAKNTTAEHGPEFSKLHLEQERWKVEMRRSLIASFKALLKSTIGLCVMQIRALTD